MHILYSFRRCPYAIRARMALSFAGIEVQVVEVSLKNKPQALIDISPKASVPVLHLCCGTVIDESLDIMHWAFLNLTKNIDEALVVFKSTEAQQLTTHNDTEFKYWLDRYKYHDRYPGHTFEFYRQKVLMTLQDLDARLQQNSFLLTDTELKRPSYVDIALFPFVRQCAAVDVQWFESLPLAALQAWRDYWLQHPVFLEVMLKRK